jgi:glycylpeptide N-tetradecanoyltransferase
MPQENSKIADPDAAAAAAAEAVAESSKAAQDTKAAEASESSGDEATEAVEGGEQASEKKKKNMKRKIKDALAGKGKAPEIESVNAPAGQHLSKDQMKLLLEANPALRNELAAKTKGKEEMEQLMRKLNINEMLTGLAPGAKNVKDMGSHAFWKTQPVPSFEELANPKEKIIDGPIKEIDIEKVPKEPGPLLSSFEWVTMDLEDEKQLEEVYDLLTNHYVEDQEAMFRFRYSPSFLNW